MTSTYLGKPYYPWWLDKLAADVTGGGAFMEGAAQGAETVRSIVITARQIYEGQEFTFAGDYGDVGFLEVYTTHVRGEPTRVVVTVTRNAAGQAQHIVVNHRPRSSVLLLSRLMGEKFAGTPIAKLFMTSESTGPLPDSGGSTGMASTYRGKPYYPAWLDHLADDVTLEGAAMNGAARGAEIVRSIVVTAREIYEGQEFSFADPAGDNGFLEDYTTRVRGKPTAVVVTVTFNASAQAQHIVVNHRPTSSMLLFSRLMGEKFAGTPIAKHFITRGS